MLGFIGNVEEMAISEFWRLYTDLFCNIFKNKFLLADTRIPVYSDDWCLFHCGLPAGRI